MFDGVSAFLQLPPLFGSFPQGFSLFVVGDVANGSDCPSFVHFSNGGENDDISLHIDTNNSVMYEVSNEYLSSKDDAAPPDQPLMLGLVHRQTHEPTPLWGGPTADTGPVKRPAPHRGSVKHHR